MRRVFVEEPVDYHADREVHEKHGIGNLPEPAEELRFRPAFDETGVAPDAQGDGNAERNADA